jgi:hypothetical protein
LPYSDEISMESSGCCRPKEGWRVVAMTAEGVDW